MNRRLYRCRHDKRIAGVASGIAEYFDADPSLVRVLWVLSIFFGGLGPLLYIAMAIIVPLEPEEGFAPAGGPAGGRGDRRPGDRRRPRTAGPPGPTGWHSVPAAHRHATPRQRPGDHDLRDRPDPVRRARPGRHVPAGVGGQRPLPVARVHRRDRGPPGGDRRATRADRLVIGGAVLIVGLLLILAGLASAWIPGEATFASSGIAPCPGDRRRGRDGPARARPAGAQPDPGVPALPDPPGDLVRERRDRPRPLRRHLRVRVPRLARLGRASPRSSPASASLFIALAIEGSRLVARIERWRVVVRGRRAASSPTRTGRSGAASSQLAPGRVRRREPLARRALRRGQLPARGHRVRRRRRPSGRSRCGSLTMPLWYDAVAGASLPAYLDSLARPRRADRGRPRPGRRRPAAGRRVALAARHGPPPRRSSPASCAPPRAASSGARSRRSRRAARPSSTSRRASCTGSSATSTTAPSSAW